MFNEATRIQGKPHIRLKGNVIPQQLAQQEPPKMGDKHTAPPRNGETLDFQKQGRIARPVGQLKAGEKANGNSAVPQPQAVPVKQTTPAANDPVNPFTDLAAKDKHMKNDMIAMLGTMYQQKRRNPNSTLTMPNLKAATPDVEQMYKDLFATTQNLSLHQMAVFAKKIQQAGSVTPTNIPTAPQQPTGQAAPSPTGATQSAQTASMSRLSQLLKQEIPSLSEPQIAAISKVVNKTKKKV